MRNAIGDHQPAAQHLDDAEVAGLRRGALPQLDVPQRAAVGHACAAVVPGRHADVLADVEVDVAVARGLAPGRTAETRAVQREGREHADDAGEQIQVDAWTADNTATVRYRGTMWTAVPAGGTPQGPGLHRVREVNGTRLVVEKI